MPDRREIETQFDVLIIKLVSPLCAISVDIKFLTYFQKYVRKFSMDIGLCKVVDNLICT